MLEAWTLLAAPAARTRRLRLGLPVTSNRIRPPAVLGKTARTVAVISGGRPVMALGLRGPCPPRAGRRLVDEIITPVRELTGAPGRHRTR
ncbi:LLM class flavin-dependent oxidoreductase [Streptomyces sp. NPDC059766]|uniref:LLM class flavin-dependent oxidoreductase n=1 Tax=Streptomyces sp. NPDC059766 TaxID=3346940 RepID=UPI003668D5A8